MDHLLTFEHDAKDEVLRIHADSEGLAKLIATLQRLKEKADQGKPDHDHLMTEAWGGTELSPEKQDLSDDSTLINHVKIYGWPIKKETTEQSGGEVRV